MAANLAIARERPGNALPVGEVINGWVIEEVLGQGGFGITYKAHKRIIGQTRAVKEFFPSSLAHREGGSRLAYSQTNEEVVTWALKKFEETTTTLARLEHDNIVKVHDYVAVNDTGYMIMDYLEGETLKAWLAARSSPAGLDELRPLLEPVLRALSYVNSQKLVHRDVAPDNIVITRSGRPILIDFGSVSHVLTQASAARNTVGLFKKHFTAPEQAQAKSVPGVAADVYSCGAVLYCALTGEPPADSQERMHDLHLSQTRRDPYRPMSTWGLRDCPLVAMTAIDASLSLRMEDRPKDIDELLGALWPKNGSGLRFPSGAANTNVVTRPVSTPVSPPSPIKPDNHGETDKRKAGSGSLLIGAAIIAATVFGAYLIAKGLERRSDAQRDFATTQQEEAARRAAADAARDRQQRQDDLARDQTDRQNRANAAEADRRKAELDRQSLALEQDRLRLQQETERQRLQQEADRQRFQEAERLRLQREAEQKAAEQAAAQVAANQAAADQAERDRIDALNRGRGGSSSEPFDSSARWSLRYDSKLLRVTANDAYESGKEAVTTAWAPSSAPNVQFFVQVSRNTRCGTATTYVNQQLKQRRGGSYDKDKSSDAKPGFSGHILEGRGTRLSDGSFDDRYFFDLVLVRRSDRSTIYNIGVKAPYGQRDFYRAKLVEMMNTFETPASDVFRGAC